MGVSTRRLLVVGVVAALAAGVAVWWFDARTQREAVVARLGDALVARFPGATLAALDANHGRVALTSGRAIDVRVGPIAERCRLDRSGCSAAIEHAVDDAARVDRLAQQPRRAALQVLVVDEPNRGYQLGYVAEPLLGPLEVRYALVDGDASTFVTPAIADLMGMTAPELKKAALAGLAATGNPRVEALSGEPGVYRVLGDIDPVAELAAPERMRGLCAIVGTTRIVGVVPARGSLLIARDDAAGRRALASRSGKTAPGARTSVAFAYDAASPAGLVATTLPGS